MAADRHEKNPGLEQSGQAHGSRGPFKDSPAGIPDTGVANREGEQDEKGDSSEGVEGRDQAPRNRGRAESGPWLGGG